MPLVRAEEKLSNRQTRRLSAVMRIEEIDSYRRNPNKVQPALKDNSEGSRPLKKFERIDPVET